MVKAENGYCACCSALDSQYGRQPGSYADGDGGRPWHAPERERRRRQPPQRGDDEYGMPSWALTPLQQRQPSNDSGRYDGTI